MARTVTLSLISHTNVGKTTLARTLLRREVGEVIDQAHVTEVSEEYTLIQAGDASLRLWDTPGFGDLTRLMKRLRRENEPLGWLLHQVWDRMINRPLWCSQEAARNVKNEADVVLYLVNAAEEPEDAGYIPSELELLTWIGRPVLALLNQVGEGGEALEARWREFVARWPVVRDVLSLDAFTRCWVEEDVLFRHVAEVLEGPKREAMVALATAWNDRNLAVFRGSCEAMADYLIGTAVDREAPGANGDGEDSGGEGGVLGDFTKVLKSTTLDRKRAMAALNDRLDRATAALMERLIAEHGLYGESAAKIEQRIQDFQVKGSTSLSERSGALAGAVVSGALGGLAADALSGGLSLGGGMIAGGILGALGGAALARGYRMVGGREEPSVTWAPQFLDQLSRQVLLRYLAVAHFGRGRGPYRDLDRPARWSEAVERALVAREKSLTGIWDAAERKDKKTGNLVAILDSATREVLRDAYPRAGRLLADPVGRYNQV
jgi:hypothetical protein